MCPLAVDFPNNKKLQDLISSAWKNGKIVSSVCHGPIGRLTFVSCIDLPRPVRVLLMSYRRLPTESTHVCTQAWRTSRSTASTW